MIEISVYFSYGETKLLANPGLKLFQFAAASRCDSLRKLLLLARTGSK
jgi:hypothetical protein